MQKDKYYTFNNLTMSVCIYRYIMALAMYIITQIYIKGMIYKKELQQSLQLIRLQEKKKIKKYK